MKNVEQTGLFHDNPMLIKASFNQRKFLTESTYSIITPEGKNFQRAFEILAFNKLSGSVLVKEKLSFSNDNYERVYVLSTEGKSEKYKGSENF